MITCLWYYIFCWERPYEEYKREEDNVLFKSDDENSWLEEIFYRLRIKKELLSKNLII